MKLVSSIIRFAILTVVLCTVAARDIAKPDAQRGSHLDGLANLHRIPFSFYNQGTFQPVDHESSFTASPASSAVAPVTVRVLCGSSAPLCFVKACDIIDHNRNIVDGLHIGEVVLTMPADAGDTVINSHLTIVVCIRLASESRALFFELKDDSETGNTTQFACVMMTVSSDVEQVCDATGNNCSLQARIDLTVFKDSFELLELVLYEFHAYVEIDMAVGTVAAVSQPVYLTTSSNVNVLVWGDHGGTMKTAVEMLLLAGVVPERLYCFQHQDWYSYVLSTVACTRPPFPLDLSKFLKSLVINDPSVEGFGGLAHSSIGNNKSVFLEFSNKWSKEFDVFDVRLPTRALVALLASKFPITDYRPGHLD